MAKKNRDGVYLRGDVYWHRDPLTGQKVSTGTKIKEEAIRIHWEGQRLADDPRYLAAAKASLGHWFEKTMQVKANDKSKSTLSNYTQ